MNNLEIFLTILQILLLPIVVAYFAFRIMEKLDDIHKIFRRDDTNDDESDPDERFNNFNVSSIVRTLIAQKKELLKHNDSQSKDRVKLIDEFVRSGLFQADIVGLAFLKTDGGISFDDLILAVSNSQYGGMPPANIGFQLFQSAKIQVEGSLKFFQEFDLVVRAGSLYQMTSEGREFFESALRERIEFDERYARRQSSPQFAEPGCKDGECLLLITSNSDDASEVPTDGLRLFDVNAENIYLGSCDDGSPITTGLRFNGLNVPKGARIESAYLEFTADGPYEDPISFSIYAENAGFSEAFSDGDRPADRLGTSNRVSWHIMAGERWYLGEVHRSPDISAVIQEVVDQDDWAAQNPLSILIKGIVYANRGVHRRMIGYLRAEREKDLLSPRLIVKYRTSS